MKTLIQILNEQIIHVDLDNFYKKIVQVKSGSYPIFNQVKDKMVFEPSKNNFVCTMTFPALVLIVKNTRNSQFAFCLAQNPMNNKKAIISINAKDLVPGLMYKTSKKK